MLPLSREQIIYGHFCVREIQEQVDLQKIGALSPQLLGSTLHPFCVPPPQVFSTIVVQSAGTGGIRPLISATHAP